MIGFKPVERIPSSGRNRLQAMIEAFYNSDAEVAEVTYAEGDYANGNVARSVIYTAIKRSGYRIKVIKRGTKIYLAKD